ncbi:Altered inheritance of mitochondria protein [Melia azedarach]|uniref:Altered inheritance of mitochondria protein n=1 Tax=Melia azedarach TaxID=155640 RepID=A0ACC1XRY9_MELAZ|nr:Altered inheritance of mitochondria protein [Melia azedarach]
MDSGKEEEIGDDNPQQKQNQEGPKGKSCKGYLYYSSTLKSHNRNPRCIGVPRTLHQVPKYVVGQSEVEASKDERVLFDFYYACAGSSVYRNLQDASNDKQVLKTELPVCVGLELLVDRKVADADGAPSPAPVHAHHRENVRDIPRREVHNKPADSSGDDFLSRFTRNADLVASGVAKNMRRVGKYIKESIDDILYPYRKRPK